MLFQATIQDLQAQPASRHLIFRSLDERVDDTCAQPSIPPRGAGKKKEEQKTSQCKKIK